MEESRETSSTRLDRASQYLRFCLKRDCVMLSMPSAVPSINEVAIHRSHGFFDFDPSKFKYLSNKVCKKKQVCGLFTRATRFVWVMLATTRNQSINRLRDHNQNVLGLLGTDHLDGDIRISSFP